METAAATKGMAMAIAKVESAFCWHTCARRLGGLWKQATSTAGPPICARHAGPGRRVQEVGLQGPSSLRLCWSWRGACEARCRRGQRTLSKQTCGTNARFAMACGSAAAGELAAVARRLIAGPTGTGHSALI